MKTSTKSPASPAKTARQDSKRKRTLANPRQAAPVTARTRVPGKIIAITGGFGALGRAVAEAARAEGARIALIDRGKPSSAVDADLLLPGIDLSRAMDAHRAFERVRHAFGRLDALLNLAGAFEWHLIGSADANVWEHLYRANVLTAVNACRAALPLMSAGASIVNVAAAAAARAERGMGPYAAAKSGVLRLTEALSEELRPRRIRVNAVSPTIIDTPRNRADMPRADRTHWLHPHDLARVLLFLASARTAAINGVNVEARA